MILRCAASALLLVAAGQAQESSLTARRLFYGENPESAASARPAETPKTRPTSQPQTQAKSAENRKSPPAESAKPKVEVAAGPASRNSGNGSPNSAPIVPAALHLGLRYNVFNVNAQTGAKSYADPDSAFHEGDCVAVEFETNRSGDVYVFNYGSTGSWTPLIPEAPGEVTRVNRGQTARVPVDGCFKFDNNPGLERLLFVVTEFDSDSDSLRRAMQREKAPTAEPSLLAENRLGSQLDELRNAVLVRRDLTIEKVATAQGPNEPPGAVYVVRTVANDRDRIVFEVPLRHE